MCERPTSRRKALQAAVLTVMFAGCPQSNEPEARSPDDVVTSWEEDGHYTAYGPSAEDVELLRAHIPDSLDALKAVLTHEERHVRRRTSEAIEMLGPDAQPLSPDLRDAFANETDEIVRGDFAMAMGSLGDRSVDHVQFLRTAFSEEQHAGVRTYLAGALVGASDRNEDPDAWEWLMESLEPGTEEYSSLTHTTAAYWEPRKAASYMLGKMGREAEPALPRMQELGEHPHTPFQIKRRLGLDVDLILEANDVTQ